MNEPWKHILRHIVSICQHEKNSVMSKSNMFWLGHPPFVQLFRFQSQTLENEEEGLPGAKSNNENSAWHSATDSPDFHDVYVEKQGWATGVAAETRN